MEAYEEGKITEDTALLYCTKRGPVTRGIDNIKKGRGETTTTMGSLRMKPVPTSQGATAPVSTTVKLK
jgi:twitching motility protein PilT